MPSAHTIPMKYGYKASAEQFAPRELLDYSRLAEELGLETIAVSDHFQPWRHHGRPHAGGASRGWARSARAPGAPRSARAC